MFRSRVLLNSSGKRIPLAYDIKSIEIPQIEIQKSTTPGDKLVANIEFSGFMPDHLDFIAFVAKILTDKSSIPSSPIISKPTATKRINTLVSPFVHSKTKNVFEQKTFSRVLQIYDTHLQTVEQIAQSLISIMPPGINLRVEKFNYTTIEQIDAVGARDSDVSSGSESVLGAAGNDSETQVSFEEQVDKRKQEYLKKFS